LARITNGDSRDRLLVILANADLHFCDAKADSAPHEQA